MVVANAPLITASVGGFVAAKMVYDQKAQRCQKRFRAVERSTRIEPVRPIKDISRARENNEFFKLYV